MGAVPTGELVEMIEPVGTDVVPSLHAVPTGRVIIGSP
jgi:hypothetical protein